MQQKRYWLRGGLIGICLYIFATIVLIPFGHEPNCSWLCFPYWSYPSMVGGGFLIGILEAITRIKDDFFEFAFWGTGIYVFSTITYFIVGAILGWLYGKIKNKKAVSQSLIPNP